MDHANQQQAQGVNHIPYLDGWRGIAIICVLCTHFSGMDLFGTLGVTVFFVLSGILMSRILFIDRMPLAKFYRRRAARILPVFLLYLAVVFTAWYLVFGKSGVTELLYTALFLRTYMPGTTILHSAFPIGHIWSLNVEEHSYMLLSVIALIARRDKTVAGILAGIALLCLGFFFVHKFNLLSNIPTFLSRSEVAAFPLMLSSAIFMVKHHHPFRAPWWTAMLALAAAFALSLGSFSTFIGWFGPAVLCAVAVNTLETSPPWFLQALAHPVLVWFGVCSYSIYLWQQVFYFCNRYATDIPYYNILAVALSLIVASCSYYFFEQPMRRWLAGKR